MIIKPIGNVELPRKPRRGMDGLAFSESVYRSIQQLRDRVFVVHNQQGPGRDRSSLCPFGELVSMSTGGFTTGILGGLVYAGDKNFNVPQRGINLASSGTWLIYLEIDCESNRDDDGEILLPGIKTSAETDPSTFWQSASWSAGPPETQYPDNTNTEVSDGLGTIIIPIGKLTVDGGSASFSPVACGNVTIGQCAGILSHTRA